MALSLSDPTSRKRSRSKLVQDPDQKAKSRKRAFSDFFTFCNFVLAYEEQLAADTNTPVKQLDQSRIDGELESARPESRVGGEERDIERGAGSAGESLHNSSSPSSTARSESSDDSSSSSDSDSGSGSSHDQVNYTSDDESWNTVTCFCGRPFAGRPMIECSKCLTWVHLYCARIKKSNVPEVYTCPKCRGRSDKTVRRRKSRDTTSDESVA